MIRALARRPRGRGFLIWLITLKPIQPGERWVWMTMNRYLVEDRTKMKLRIRQLEAKLGDEEAVRDLSGNTYT